MFKLAHLSDLHLGPLPRARLPELLNKRAFGYVNWWRGRRRHHTPAALAAVLADRLEQGVDHTVITGDLVNIALPDEFAAAALWLREVGAPDAVSVIPGNHDAYVASALGGWSAWAPYMGGEEGSRVELPFVRRVGPAALIGLSTAVPTPAGYASGLLGAPQVAALERHLGYLKEEGLLRVVLLHHPPVDGWSPRRKALKDAEGFRAAIRRHGAELVLCGHEHRLAVGALDGPEGEVPVFCAPSSSAGPARGPAAHGGGGGRGAGIGGGYLLYAFEALEGGWRLSAEHRALDPATGRVEARLATAFARRPELAARRRPRRPAGALAAEAPPRGAGLP